MRPSRSVTMSGAGFVSRDFFPESRLPITTIRETKMRVIVTALLGFCCQVGFLASSANADIVEAWGRNDYGQLGNGVTINQNAAVQVIGLNSDVSQISAGVYQTLALEEGAVYAWGSNFNGQLGDGTTIGHLTPEPVATLSSGVTAVAAGGSHCLALKNGLVYGWGFNGHGEVGNGNGQGQTTPVLVVGLTGVSAIVAGGSHSLALKNGGVYAWGYNLNGQIGNGRIGNANAYTPVAVTGLSSGVTAIAAGASHSMAIQNGELYTWGYNGYGQLGDGTGIDRAVPVPVVGFTSGVTAIAAGADHSLAVKDGHVYTWGGNYLGQLGVPVGAPDSTPQEIDPADLTNIVALSAAATTSYALAADGSLWVWGYGGYGELGLGSYNDQSTPQHLLPPAGYAYTSIDANGGGNTAVATLAPVPEPTSLSLLAIGGIALLRRRRGS